MRLWLEIMSYIKVHRTAECISSTSPTLTRVMSMLLFFMTLSCFVNVRDKVFNVLQQLLGLLHGCKMSSTLMLLMPDQVSCGRSPGFWRWGQLQREPRETERLFVVIIRAAKEDLGRFIIKELPVWVDGAGKGLGEPVE